MDQHIQRSGPLGELPRILEANGTIFVLHLGLSSKYP
jgi:hypothetical protein